MSSILEPVSTRIVARIVNDPPFSIFLAAPGTPGTNGKDGQSIDLEKIRLEANAAARAEVQALVTAGGLRGADGKPWSPVGASEAELQAIVDALPPIKFTLIKDGKEYSEAQKLGPKQEFRLRFIGAQKTVVSK
jgi:hypothetical protein